MPHVLQRFEIDVECVFSKGNGGAMNAKSIHYTLIAFFSFYRGRLGCMQSKKLMPHALQHFEIDAECVLPKGNGGVMNSKSIHYTLIAFFRIYRGRLGCMQLIPL